MSDTNNLLPETEDDLPDEQTDALYDAEELTDVDELGGDADILESLPDDPEPSEAPEDPLDEGSPFLTFRVDEEIEDIYADDDPYGGTLDIEAALAAVSSLSDVEAKREAEQAAALEAEREIDQAAAAEAQAEAEPRPPVRVKAPPMVSLRRGQPASVIPALALMAVGAWLTIALTSGVGMVSSPLVVVGIVGAVLVGILLAQWLTSGRWSRGVFFVALLALLLAGALYYDSIARLGLAGPLALAAVGAAFFLTGLLARPADRRLFVPGVLMIAAGLVAAAAVRGLLPGVLLANVAPLWWIVAAALVVIWLLPVVFRRRG